MIKELCKRSQKFISHTVWLEIHWFILPDGVLLYLSETFYVHRSPSSLVPNKYSRAGVVPIVLQIIVIL